MNFRSGLAAMAALVLSLAATPSQADGLKPWAIISDQSQRFVYYPDPNDTGAPAIFDRSTGLIWGRTILNPPATVLSSDAINFCDEFSVNGEFGFRLPKASELTSVMLRNGSNAEWITGPYFDIPNPTSIAFHSGEIAGFGFLDNSDLQSFVTSWKFVTAGSVTSLVQSSVGNTNGTPRARCVRGGSN